MDSHPSSPLIIAVDEPPPPRSHANDIHILSFAFLFIFSAYGAAQNLETTVNTEQDLGTISLGILYTSFTVFSVVASLVVRALGSKRALILGSSGYLLFIASNLKPSWEHISLPLHVAMPKIANCMKEQLLATSMENFGGCLLVTRKKELYLQMLIKMEF